MHRNEKPVCRHFTRGYFTSNTAEYCWLKTKISNFSLQIPRRVSCSLPGFRNSILLLDLVALKSLNSICPLGKNNPGKYFSILCEQKSRRPETLTFNENTAPAAEGYPVAFKAALEIFHMFSSVLSYYPLNSCHRKKSLQCQWQKTEGQIVKLLV